MNRPRASIAQNQTTFTSRIVRVFLQYHAMGNGLLDFRRIQIFLQPLPLGMNAELVLPFSDALLNTCDVH